MKHDSDDEHSLMSPSANGHPQRPPNLRHSRSSIDESLELEHALDRAEEESDDGTSPNQTSLLDPQVLADIIVGLREQIAHMTGEREELATFLTQCQSRQAELSDDLGQSKDREAALRAELDISRKKNEEDTEAISMLRNKVEDSRRALVRLQQEASNARRASGQFQLGNPLALDLSGVRTGTGNTMSKSAKRSSFTPLTGSSFAKQQTRTSPPPSITSSPPAGKTSFSDDNDQTFTLPGADPDGATATTRGRGFPTPSTNLGAELDALRKELVEARQESASLRAEVHDAQESRRASEAMVAALREFVASGQAAAENALVSPLEGSRPLGISLPPLPTDSGIDELGDEERPKPTPAAGWGLKLWRKDTGTSTNTSNSAQSVSSSSQLSRRKSDASSIAESVNAQSVRTGFWAARSPSVSTAVSPASGVPPAHKKFGFLWGAAATTPVTATPPTPPKEDKDGELPALSPPGSTTEGSTSVPTSPPTRQEPDLVVQFDDTLSDNESVGSDRDRQLSAAERTPGATITPVTPKGATPSTLSIPLGSSSALSSPAISPLASPLAPAPSS